MRFTTPQPQHTPRREFGVLVREPEVQEAVWKALNALGGEVVKREGRVYGGGLHKVEPSELLKSSASSVLEAARAAAAANAQCS